jgi:hypothetical protein
MVKLNQVKTSSSDYKFLDKSKNILGSCFKVDNNNEFLINPCFPVSKEFSEKKLYICESPEIAKERLEGELNCWLQSLKEVNKKTMKIALDIHGVCDANPEFFVELSKLFIQAGHEIIIITGMMESHGAIDEIEKLGIYYTKFYSIADYHKKKGTELWYDDKGNPWIDDDTWNQTKAEICEKEKIDFHIDDSPIYGEYFKTPYAQIIIKKD